MTRYISFSCDMCHLTFTGVTTSSYNDAVNTHNIFIHAGATNREELEILKSLDEEFPAAKVINAF